MENIYISMDIYISHGTIRVCEMSVREMRQRRVPCDRLDHMTHVTAPVNVCGKRTICSIHIIQVCALENEA